MSETTHDMNNAFWFEDGDIVLKVEEDGAEQHFRVHRAILAMASPVFRDVLSMSQPDDDGEPTLTLQDSAQDLSALLGALYSGRKAQTVTFDIALGILRLSHKYQIDGLQQSIRQRLQEDWPIMHSDYLVRQKLLENPRYRVAQSLKLIEAAQQCRVNELLPTAFYELSVAWVTSQDEIVHRISHDNLVRLCVGRTRSQQRLKALTVWEDSDEPPSLWDRDANASSVTIFHHKPHGCNASSGYTTLYKHFKYCKMLFTALETQLAKRLFREEFAHGALQQTCHDSEDIIGAGVCSKCMNWVLNILRNKSDEIWENIPVDFDLPNIDPKLYSESIFKPL